jgi:alanyl-tRNA synthetase
MGVDDDLHVPHVTLPGAPGQSTGTTMTERLDLADSYLTRFDAEIVSAESFEGRTAVVLSRTAFHPEGGGQPADRGTLGEARVIDVQERDGRVLHVLDGAAPAPGARVAGEVDWGRRFDHMQQHHGQHLLSAAFEAVLGARTVSFHLGEATCSIDLDASADRLRPTVLADVEAAANRLVWRDLVVEARELAPDELARLALRKEPTKGSRVVVVRGGAPGGPEEVVDASPCGGTHPRRTGEVGAIAVLRAQKWGAGARVEFACGARVVALLRTASERLADVASALRCAPPEAPAAAARLAAESLGRKKDLDRLALVLAQGEADRLAAREGVVVEELTVPAGDAAGYLRGVAQALAARGRVAVLGARGDGRGYLCFARPKGAGADLGALLREAVAVLGGKGGGAPDLAQGGGPLADKLAEALALARAKAAAT